MLFGRGSPGMGDLAAELIVLFVIELFKAAELGIPFATLVRTLAPPESATSPPFGETVFTFSANFRSLRSLIRCFRSASLSTARLAASAYSITMYPKDSDE